MSFAPLTVTTSHEDRYFSHIFESLLKDSNFILYISIIFSCYLLYSRIKKITWKKINKSNKEDKIIIKWEKIFKGTFYFIFISFFLLFFFKNFFPLNLDILFLSLKENWSGTAGIGKNIKLFLVTLLSLLTIYINKKYLGLNSWNTIFSIFSFLLILIYILINININLFSIFSIFIPLLTNLSEKLYFILQILISGGIYSPLLEGFVGYVDSPCFSVNYAEDINKPNLMNQEKGQNNLEEENSTEKDRNNNSENNNMNENENGNQDKKRNQNSEQDATKGSYLTTPSNQNNQEHKLRRLPYNNLPSLVNKSIRYSRRLGDPDKEKYLLDRDNLFKSWGWGTKDTIIEGWENVKEEDLSTRTEKQWKRKILIYLIDQQLQKQKFEKSYLEKIFRNWRGNDDNDNNNGNTSIL